MIRLQPNRASGVTAPEPLEADEAAARGRQEAAELEARFGGLDGDPALNDRLQRLGREVLESRAWEGVEVDLRVLKTARNVGQCHPGGEVYLSRGMLERQGDEQIRFVLGHEFGHLEGRDDAQRYAWEDKVARLGWPLRGL